MKLFEDPWIKLTPEGRKELRILWEKCGRYDNSKDIDFVVRFYPCVDFQEYCWRHSKGSFLVKLKTRIVIWLLNKLTD